MKLNYINLIFYNLYIWYATSLYNFFDNFFAIKLSFVKLKIIFLSVLLLASTTLFYTVWDFYLSISWIVYLMLLNIETAFYTKKHLNKSNLDRYNISNVSNNIVILGVILGLSLNYF